MKRHALGLFLAALLVLSGCGARAETAAETPPIQEREDASAVSAPEGTPADTAEETPAPESEIPSETPVEEIIPVIPDPPSDPAALVRVADYIPGIEVDLKYATADNFTGTVIYDFTDAYLRYGTVEKLAAVQEELEEMGYGLKIWDALRPVSAQFRLWEVCPNAAYVANPNTGYSSHSRGNTVDITLVALDGSDVPMPTDFDDFSALADRDYSDCGEQAASNARLLEETMAAHGFQPYWAEWWHFSDAVSYGVEEGFVIPAAP